MPSLDWTPASCPITVTHGDTTQEVTIELEQDDTPWNPDTVIAQVRVRRDRTSTLVMDLEPTVDGDTVTLPAGLDIDADPGSYWWDLQADGLTVLTGAYRILKDVSVEEGS